MKDRPDLVECNANVIYCMNSKIDLGLDFQVHGIYEQQTHHESE